LLEGSQESRLEEGHREVELAVILVMVLDLESTAGFLVVLTRVELEPVLTNKFKPQAKDVRMINKIGIQKGSMFSFSYCTSW
jgi:hypothetical protein